MKTRIAKLQKKLKQIEATTKKQTKMRAKVRTKPLSSPTDSRLAMDIALEVLRHPSDAFTRVELSGLASAVQVFHAQHERWTGKLPAREALSIFLPPGSGAPQRVELGAVHADSRGSIQNLVHQPVGSVTVITSCANTTRAQHYHKQDAHLCFVVSGEVHYYSRKVGETCPPHFRIFTPGEMFATQPMEEHEMYFPVSTVFITLGNLPRTKTSYETDLMRFGYSLRELYLQSIATPAPLAADTTPPASNTTEVLQPGIEQPSTEKPSEAALS